ncbi:MAG: aminotransferase class V-fold PLP-dependent enzyme [Acidobacteriota bacterium]
MNFWIEQSRQSGKNLFTMIYFDNNATTATAPQVVEAMMPYLSGSYGNPSSSHAMGLTAGDAVATAREQVAELLNADPSEIFFTSGGTEADNWAVFGGFGSRPQHNHVITTKVEHEAVRNSCHTLEQSGARVTRVDVDRDGLIDLSDLKRALTKKTAIVSIMMANNETGVLFPVEEIADVVKGNSDALFHVDAVNAAGKIKIDLAAPGIDLLSISGHKFHGPKGTGALFIRRGVAIKPYLIGGGQERAARAGTEAVHQIVALGAAARLATDLTLMEWVRSLRDRLENGILDMIPNASLNGTADRSLRLPNTSNISFENTNGEAILARLDDIGVCVSTGSACNSDSHAASPVLQAMNVPYSRAMGSIRFSLGRYNSEDEVDLVLEKLPGIVESLRALAG